MGLKERVEEFRRREHGNMLREDAYAASEVNDVVDEVSEMAAETDALMAEMAEALEDQKHCDPTDKQDVLWCHKGIVAALDSYNQYKDKTND